MTGQVVRITRHECRVIWRDHRFRWGVGILALLLTIAGALHAERARERSAAIAAAQQEQREQWLTKRVANAHVAAHAGITVFRAANSLATFDSGIEDIVGQSVFLEPHRRSLPMNSTAERASVTPQFAVLTVAFILQTLVPLLIVLLTFTAIAGEREQGTLRLLASIGVRPSALGLGKALGSMVPLLVVAVPATGVGGLLAYARGDVDLSRAGLLALSYGIYVCLLVALGLAVSAHSRTTSGALTALLGVWLVVSVLAPRGAFALAQHLSPNPTADAFAAALDAIERAGDNGFMLQRAAVERRLLTEHGVTRPSDLPASTWGMTLFEREEESTARYNAEFARLYDAYDRQQRIVDLLSLAAPPLALRTVSMSLSGTDTAHYRHFTEAAETYRHTLVQAMNSVAIESRLYNSSPTFADGPDQPAFPEGESAAYARVGPFSYRPPDSAWALRQAAVPASALVAWTVIAGALLVWTVGRVRVE